MNTILEYITGLDVMTDQVIAMDFLNAAKSGVRNYAAAVTEAATPEIKATLIKQLDEAIDTHEQITIYLMDKGWYHPWDLKEQSRLELQNMQTALKLPTL